MFARAFLAPAALLACAALAAAQVSGGITTAAPASGGVSAAIEAPTAPVVTPPPAAPPAAAGMGPAIEAAESVILGGTAAPGTAAPVDVVMPLAGGAFDTAPIYNQTTPVVLKGAAGGKGQGYHFHGVSYSPFGVGDNRLCPPFDATGGMCLLPSQVALDMKALATLTSRVKTYSSVCTAATRQILLSAREEGMKVMFGVWLEPNVTKNLDEIKRTVAFATEFKDVISHFMVGNEPVFVLAMPALMVADSVKVVRKQLADAGVTGVPIGVADIYNMWMGTPVGDEAEKGKLDRNMAPVAAECDFIGLNSHAYWGGIDPTTRRSGKHVADGARQVAEKWGKPCIITETGYPTVGEPHETVDGIAETGLSRQTLFLSDMEVESRSQNLAVYMFEPFDGDWKRRWAPYVEMDYSFGFAKCDRTMKDVQFPPLGAW